MDDDRKDIWGTSLKSEIKQALKYMATKDFLLRATTSLLVMGCVFVVAMAGFKYGRFNGAIEACSNTEDRIAVLDSGKLTCVYPGDEIRNYAPSTERQMTIGEFLRAINATAQINNGS